MSGKTGNDIQSSWIANMKSKTTITSLLANAGQINFYLNWVKENVWPPAENDPWGIILCSDKNNATVKYARRNT